MCACLQTRVRDYRQVSYDTGNAKKEVSTGWVSPPQGPSEGGVPERLRQLVLLGSQPSLTALPPGMWTLLTRFFFLFYSDTTLTH